MIKDIKEFLKNITYINSIEVRKKSYYEIVVKCDANDGDYITDSIEVNKEDFEKDDLLQLVISYISKLSGKFSKRWDNFYGHHVGDNEEIYWLEDYLVDNELLLFCGAIDSRCHSISDIAVSYFDENGIEYNVEFPDIDEYFNTRLDMTNYLNNLYQDRIIKKVPFEKP